MVVVGAQRAVTKGTQSGHDNSAAIIAEPQHTAIHMIQMQWTGQLRGPFASVDQLPLGARMHCMHMSRLQHLKHLGHGRLWL